MNNTSKIEAFDRMTCYRSSTSYYSLSNDVKTLYIPLILWESYGIENYIPFCSIFNSKLKLEIEFSDLVDLYVSSPQTTKYIVQPKMMVKQNKIRLNLSVNTLPASTSNNLFEVSVISDQIVLNKDEQKLLQKHKQEYVFPQLLHQTEKILGNSHKVYLQFNTPIKQIIWIITDHDTIEDYEFRNFDKAQFILGNDMMSANHNNFLTSDYYKYCQSYYHNEGIPEHNIFSYSFALRPYFGHPSGIIDFAKLKVKILEIQGDIKNKYIHIFANGINVLETDNGISSIKLKLR